MPRGLQTPFGSPVRRRLSRKVCSASLKLGRVRNNIQVYAGIPRSLTSASLTTEHG